MMSMFSYLIALPRHCVKGNARFTIVKRIYETQRLNFSMKSKGYVFPVLKDEDLEEEFVRGSGPGGQSVNTTSNCVVLKHKPTGIVVKCHESRSVFENQRIARLKLQEKLDLHLHGSDSFVEQQRAEARMNKEGKKRKAKVKLEKKKAFKEREGFE